MSFISRNLGLILKTFLYQIVMSLFGLMLYGATNQNTVLLVIGQACVLLFFFYIMFTQMYQKGFKNREYDWAHEAATSPFWGFLFALIAFLPAIFTSVFTMIFPPFAENGTILNDGGYVAYLLNKSFLQGMFAGIHQTLIPTVQGTDALNGQCLLHLISALPGILTCGVGYLIGMLRFGHKKS